MIGIIVVAHAPLSTAMVDCVCHVLGAHPDRLIAIDALPDEPVGDLVVRVSHAAMHLSDEDGIVFLTDLFGATPSNAVVQAVGEQIDVPSLVVSGCNVPMLLRALTYRDQSLQSVGEKIIMGGRNGIVSTASTPPQRQTFNPADQDASARDYHQQ